MDYTFFFLFPDVEVFAPSKYMPTLTIVARTAMITNMTHSNNTSSDDGDNPTTDRLDTT